LGGIKINRAISALVFFTKKKRSKMSRRKFFEAALNEAQKSSMTNCHGCVIVIGGKVVSVGHNTERTTMRNQQCCSVHAEMCALSHLLRGRFQSCEKSWNGQSSSSTKLEEVSKDF
jgi:pyrimidine deaminase RibD-like protein